METSNIREAFEVLLAEAHEFHQKRASLLLGTSHEDCPVVSYAPYVTDQKGNFYVYVSELASHSKNLSMNPRASVLFVEDESESAHLFARRRVTYSCHVYPVERNSPEFETVMDHYEDEHGVFMRTLRGLVDFRLYRLEPCAATYVRGFAQAYELYGERLSQIRHINDKGHLPESSKSARDEEFAVEES